MSEEEVKTINEKLHKIDLQIQRMVSHIESEQGTLTRIAEDLNGSIKRLNSVVFGNGEAGIAENVRRLMEFEKDLKRSKWLVFSAWVAAVISVAWKGIVAFFISKN